MSTPTTETAVHVEARNATIGIFASQADAETAIRELERGGFDMKNLSLLARGMSEERHVIGTDTAAHRTGRWAGFGSIWGVLFGAFFWIPGVGHVAVGGYLLYILATGVLGAAGGALGGALTSVGIPKEGILQYETDLKADKWLLIAHGTPAEVQRARDFMSAGDPERIDVHTEAVPAT
ncbi:MAG TPA: hypothetical protein VES79_04540 [Solirubrobacteraceae bacterium]|nr:hypothetical protein [Solirubrobacteraceae bacterium]